LNFNEQDDGDDSEIEKANMNDNENNENENDSNSNSNSNSDSDSEKNINSAKNTVNNTSTNNITSKTNKTNDTTNKINNNINKTNNMISVGININITESPYWPDRAFHIHTQHPLELTDVLQGHDIPQFGPHGSHCSVFSYNKKHKYTRNNKNNKKKKYNGNYNINNNYNNQEYYSSEYDSSDHKIYHDDDNNDSNNDDNYYKTIINEMTNNENIDFNKLDDNEELKKEIIKEQKKIKKMKKFKIQEQAEIDGKLRYCERWEDMVDDVSSLFEWAVANRLNKIEWLLLGNYKWGDELETRAKRFVFICFFFLT
jgi:hypothetical protein